MRFKDLRVGQMFDWSPGNEGETPLNTKVSAGYWGDEERDHRIRKTSTPVYNVQEPDSTIVEPEVFGGRLDRLAIKNADCIVDIRAFIPWKTIEGNKGRVWNVIPDYMRNIEFLESHRLEVHGYEFRR